MVIFKATFGRSPNAAKRASQALFCPKFNVDYENTLCFGPNVRENGEKWLFPRACQKNALPRIYSGSALNVLTNLVENSNYRFFAIIHLKMGRDDHFNHQKQKFYFWSCLVNTLSATPFSESSKFDLEKKWNDELRSDVWAQPKRRQTRLTGCNLFKI